MVGNGGNLAGITIDASSRPYVWVNEMNARRVWRVHRGGHGTWGGRPDAFLQLPSWTHALECDVASNDLTMGIIDDDPDVGYGGELRIHRQHETNHETQFGYENPEVVLHGQINGYVTSAAVITGRYHILGSIVATGLQICENPAAEEAGSDGPGRAASMNSLLPPGL